MFDELIRSIQMDLDAERTGAVLTMTAGGEVWVAVAGEAVGALFLDPEWPATQEQGASAWIVAAADQVQDHVVEEIRKPWPACPDHPHPMIATEQGGGAYWACPVTGRGMVRIGEVPAARGARRD